MQQHQPTTATSPPLPLILTLNCLESPTLESAALSSLAAVSHLPLSSLSSPLLPAAAAVLLPSLSLLPRSAARRLRPNHLLLCLASPDPHADSALAQELGLRLIHVDVSRADEVADTIMALFLGLLRKTHLLSRYSSSSSAAAGWLGSIQPICRGMRRCRGLVLGIIGLSAAARCLATRSLAFQMSVLYFDLQYREGKGKSRSSIAFPREARRMDTLNDLLAASDLISLHCALSDDTVHILNEECLQHIKPGAFIVNTGSSQLIDDCALKQLLIDGTVAGCALDGADGPQWMEAWVREMPNVLILPRSADYSEEVWMEIREKAIGILKSFLCNGTVPDSLVSDEDERVSDATDEEDKQSEKNVKQIPHQVHISDKKGDISQLTSEYNKRKSTSQLNESQASGASNVVGSRSEGRRSRSGKKGKKRPARRKSQQDSDDFSEVKSDSNFASRQDDDTAMSGRDQILSSSSRFASPEDSRNKQMCAYEPAIDSTSGKTEVTQEQIGKSCALLKDGFIVALHALDRPGFHVSRQRVPGGGWFLDIISNVTKRDPAVQFLVSFTSKDVLGLRSFASGGKLLQVNRRMEFVFASHSFDVWESWMLEGFDLEKCRLVNCRNPSAALDVRIEILAAVSEEDGVARWLS